MEVNSSNTVASAFGSRNTTTRGFNELSSEDFFGLLIAELQTQDPLSPTSNQELLGQLSMIRQMEQTSTMTKTLETLAAEQRFGATSGLIGHYIAGRVTDSGGNPYEVQGLVIGVRFERSGEAILELHDGRSLPASKVEQVTLVENLPPDILEQLEAELGRAPTTPADPAPQDPAGPSGTNQPPGATAPPDGRGKLVDHLLQRVRAAQGKPEAAQPANPIAALWNSIFSPGYSGKIGA